MERQTQTLTASHHKIYRAHDISGAFNSEHLSNEAISLRCPREHVKLRGINNFIKNKLNRVVYRTMLLRAFNRRVGERRKVLNQREYHLLDFLIIQTEPTDPFSSSPSKRIPLSELVASPYIQGAYRRVTQRTFRRELIRLCQLGFIKFTFDESLKDSIVELDFGAIGKY